MHSDKRFTRRFESLLATYTGTYIFTSGQWCVFDSRDISFGNTMYLNPIVRHPMLCPIIRQPFNLNKSESLFPKKEFCFDELDIFIRIIFLRKLQQKE